MGAKKKFLLHGRKFALASNILFGVLSLAISISGFFLRFGDQRMNEATLQKIKNSARDAFGINYMQNMMKPYLLENINEYSGFNSSDQVSLGCNYVMQEHQCCGVDSSADFKSSFYYTSYCPYNGDHNAVPGCCRTLPTSSSQSWCYYYNGYYTYDQMKRYCGGNSYDSYMWKDGCSAALLRFHYTRHTEVIWSMLGIGLIDQIFLFVFAISVLQKTKYKVKPTGNSTTDVWTTGSTKTTQISSSPMSLQEQQGISSEILTQHSVPTTYVPTTSKPTGAAPPLSQPVIQLTAPTQSNFYPTQPLLPGAVMFVPTSRDYAHNTMLSTFIPGIGIQALPQTQEPLNAQQRNYEPLTMW